MDKDDIIKKIHLLFFDEELNVWVYSCSTEVTPGKISGQLIRSDKKYKYCPHCGEDLAEAWNEQRQNHKKDPRPAQA